MRNASGNTRNLVQIHNQNINNQYIGNNNHTSLTPSKISKGNIMQSVFNPNLSTFDSNLNNIGLTNGSLNHGLTGHNSKTPKEIYKRM
jgi:hypothetical protein